MRIEISNRNDDEVVYNAVLKVEQARNAIVIRDVIFSPENSVKAGRALLTSVRIKNMGEDDDEDVKVMVSIPELGISASDYIDEVESEESVTSEELYMRIPECADAGDYTATVTVEFDEGDETWLFADWSLDCRSSLSRHNWRPSRRNRREPRWCASSIWR